LKVNGSAVSNAYTVQYGDNLSSIAAKLDTTYQALAALNGLSNPNLIYPGQNLKY
ncbi:TPA: LysM peptidoglycan-binding domain-containing protein, partial [Enterococcus faecalis]|nr:LysM peptidoglycan-binding domain-containing protein [Enterococcus faecalis]